MNAISWSIFHIKAATYLSPQLGQIHFGKSRILSGFPIVVVEDPLLLVFSFSEPFCLVVLILLRHLRPPFPLGLFKLQLCILSLRNQPFLKFTKKILMQYYSFTTNNRLKQTDLNLVVIILKLNRF